jgi:membrane protease YdiL (CAAX protease family)
VTASSVEDDPIIPGRRATATVGEATVVLGGTVFVLLGTWIARLLSTPATQRGQISDFTDRRLWLSIAIEIAITVGLVPWLLRRGWKPWEIAGSPTPKDIFLGAALWLGTMVFAFVFVLTETVIIPGISQAVRVNPFHGHLSIGAVGVLVVVNAVFEEFLWLVYAIPTLANRIDLKAAAVISGALRLSVHSYQGIYAFIGVLPIAIVFTIYYAKTRRVWPVIVAHIIIDAISLGRLVH